MGFQVEGTYLSTIMVSLVVWEPSDEDVLYVIHKIAPDPDPHDDDDGGDGSRRHWIGRNSLLVCAAILGIFLLSHIHLPSRIMRA